ncbi:hypothetical protein EG68_10706 [Paragonimus skrjabini miyazakii]|uniref:Uncharacterized protein n=1 Tax=Paragonimus skrjabini miyazakii TaxID=59628 RepID=A0A8S9YEZ2_9TREM|nr:hypothetical protein EG68_10706 [Paragonimus skrjabini miyazakii]
MYPEPPPPHLPRPTMFHCPQRSPIAGQSTVRLPAFHDAPPLLLLKETAVYSTFCATRSEILSHFPPRVTTNTSSSKSVNTRKAGFDSLQSDKTTILDLVRGIVSILSTVTSQLQALETHMTRSFPPPTTSIPAIMPALLRSPARTQEELDEREAELANPQVAEYATSGQLVICCPWSWSKMPSLASRGTPTFLAKSCWYTCYVGTEMRAIEWVVAQNVLRSHQNQRMSTCMPNSDFTFENIPVVPKYPSKPHEHNETEFLISLHVFIL